MQCWFTAAVDPLQMIVVFILIQRVILCLNRCS